MIDSHNMNWLSNSPRVILTAYHPSCRDTVVGNDSREEEAPSPVSRRYGQYNMNHGKSKGSKEEKPPYCRSGSQDSLDELAMDDYWTELEHIQTSSENTHEEQEEVPAKVAAEGEAEEEWLKEAGLSDLLAESAAGPQESMVFLSTLTRTQAAAVQKRVETLTQTMRKKNKHHSIPDVRDIFGQYANQSGKDSGVHGSQAVGASEGGKSEAEIADGQVRSPSSKEGSGPLQDAPVSETDIDLEISYSEQATHLKESSKGKTTVTEGDDATLPDFRLAKDKTGTTKVGDLAHQDMKKVYSLAFIELTSLYDTLSIELKHQKPIKLKIKESGVFGVPLPALLEQDQKKIPGTKVPLIIQKLISHIEEEGLHTEGLLRIPGVATRVKSLCEELEAKFYEGTINWDNVKQHDAASLLKLFIRELPHPLLTVKYFSAFQAVQNLPTKKQQLQALNLLVVLLPDHCRDTLKALLEFLQRVIDNREQNRMTLSSVAVVMAPNLFMFKGFRSKPNEYKELAMAAGTVNIMRFLIKYQRLLWTIPKFIMNQVRKQNAENQRKMTKDKAMKKLLKKMSHDREKQDKIRTDAEVPQGVIRVQAPRLSKVSMAIQLTEELKASDILARFLSQDSGVAQSVSREEVCLYEVGGNIVTTEEQHLLKRKDHQGAH
ncbi:rho GTPase-activating protein 18 isoform X2 [Latimeria chalumnae]|uniref:rho GTPase-activating protein 18 isoform X2 n=1 Tax=Latimeria chalumnae TaxID=7897 RepID=UPI00313E0567